VLVWICRQKGCRTIITLVIAEKPSVAKSIAATLGAASKRDGYFEGNGYLISYAFGHLYTLANVKDYQAGMRSWKLKDYPFIPDQFKYQALDNAGVKKQIKIIQDLAKRADKIINACDSDREGELIFAEIKNDLQITKPIQRLWLTSHTPKDIAKGMANLRNDTARLEQAGYCRQQLDWIIGINLTVVYTLLAGGEITLKVGRVMLPTLKLIYDREEEITNFTAKPYYSLKCEFKADQDTYFGFYQDAKGNTRFDSPERLQDILKDIQGKSGIITRKNTKKSKENAPRLFNLTDLQGHITAKFKGFTAEKVLKIAQSLYEKKHLTYPRTASRYLDDSQIADAKESLNALMRLEIGLQDRSLLKFHTEKRVFDSSKVDSHPAIIPTYMVPDLGKLTSEERLVYLEVAKRFIAQFLPPAVYEVVEILTRVEKYDFITKGKVLLEEGWKQLYRSSGAPENDKSTGDQNEEEEQPISAKHLKQGDRVLTGKTELKEGKTKPPAHYTEKTLLSAMENCGKQVENEEEVLKGFTIGTPATRADTIKKLKDTGYISSQGKNLMMTELGRKVIEYFPVAALLRVTFTGRVEKTLKLIETGQYESEEFMTKLVDYVTKRVQEMKDRGIPVIRKADEPAKIAKTARASKAAKAADSAMPPNTPRTSKASTNQRISKTSNVSNSSNVTLTDAANSANITDSLGKCPDCGRDVVESAKAYSCKGTRDKTCKFTLWKEDKFFARFGKKLTKTMAKGFIKKQQVAVKGLKSPTKEGVKFDAIIQLNKNTETGYWNYKLEFEKKQANVVKPKGDK
jgi:DNA topoisomerase-3